MRRANPQILLLVLAMNIVIVAAVVLFATRGLRDTAALVGILAVLVAAYLVRRRARVRLLYRRQTDRQPHDPIPADRDRPGQR
jgi:membrane associated rhomboid family serine protease